MELLARQNLGALEPPLERSLDSCGIGARLQLHEDLCEAINSAPRSREQVGSEEWKSWSLCYTLLVEADAKLDTLAKRRELVLVTDYVLKLFPELSDKTRSVIVSSFTRKDEWLLAQLDDSIKDLDLAAIAKW